MAPALQISIPSVSISSANSNKPYTLYHVSLQLPLRTHESRKRYTDFTTLHEQLVAQTSHAPPAPLPAKSYFRSTVNNDALTESRRQGLEAYLRAIVNADDGRWRSTAAWRAFLDLPATLNGAAKGKGRSEAAVGETGLDASQWLDVHRDVKTQIHTARLVLKKRDGAATAQEQHAGSAEAKAALVRAATGIARCEEALRVLGRRGDNKEGGWGGGGNGGGGGGALGEGEIRRRRDLLTASKKEVEGLEGVLRSLVVKNAATAVNGGAGAGAAAATKGDREALWGGSASGGARKAGRVLGGPLKETERTRERDNDGVLQLQKQVMQEQEEDVLDLGKAVSRMKEMGIMINEELVVQNQMLGLLEQDVDRVDGKIDVAKKRMGKIH